MDMPILKVELEGFKQNIRGMLCDHNQELTNQIIKSINTTLTEDWVKTSIQHQVNKCIAESIKKITCDVIEKELINHVS